MLEKKRKNTQGQDGEDAVQKRKKEEEDEKRNTMTEVEFLKWLHG